MLIGAQMPSILAEISFLTNPDDAEELQKGSYRQRIAESLAAGVERYLRGLSGTQSSARPKTSATGKAATSDKPSVKRAGVSLIRKSNLKVDLGWRRTIQPSSLPNKNSSIRETRLISTNSARLVEQFPIRSQIT